MPSVALRRGQSRTAYTRSFRRSPASLATGNRAAPGVLRRLPCRSPAAERRSPQRRALRRPTCPPLGRDRAGLPDHGAAGLGSKVDLQACLAARLTSFLAPRDQQQTSLHGEWVSPVPPPRLGLPGRDSPPPQCWAFPALLLLRWGGMAPQPGPMPFALATVTSMHLHWHTVAAWGADVVLSWGPALRRWCSG